MCLFMAALGLLQKHRLFPVVVSGPTLRCTGCSLRWPLLLQSTGLRHMDSIGAHGPNCLKACQIFRDQRSDLCPLCWQVGF